MRPALDNHVPAAEQDHGNRRLFKEVGGACAAGHLEFPTITWRDYE